MSYNLAELIKPADNKTVYAFMLFDKKSTRNNSTLGDVTKNWHWAYVKYSSKLGYWRTIMGGYKVHVSHWIEEDDSRREYITYYKLTNDEPRTRSRATRNIII